MHKIDNILNELLAFDPSLEQNKEDLKDVINQMYQIKPIVKIDTEKKKKLKHDLHQKILEDKVGTCLDTTLLKFLLFLHLPI